MKLTEKHYKCIELILKGLKYTEISKDIPCSRQAIYDWLKDDDFMLALDNARQEIKTQANNKILGKVDVYVSKIEELAFNSSSEKVKLDALTFLYEAVNGKASQKIDSTVTESKDNNNDVLDLDKMTKLPIDNKIININRVK